MLNLKNYLIILNHGVKAASDLFMLKWRSTPSPKKLPSSKKSSSFLSMFDFSGKKSKKKKGKKI